MKKDKKKILIFSAFYGPYVGGAERFVQEITERLNSNYDFIILTSRISRKLPRIEKRKGIKIYRIGFGSKWDKYFFPILAPLKSFFIPHDLCHAVLESYAGLALFFYKVFRKKPALLTLQTQKVSIPNFLFRRIHLAPDKIHAISNALAQRAKNFGAENVEVIPNGVDLEKFKSLNFSKERHRIICVAHLKKVKGVRYLIQAMPEVLKEFPDAKLVLIGEGPEEKRLKLKVERLKLEKYAEFKRSLSHERIPEELAKSEVFVLPSISEGMGIAIIEAQAAGIPVIGTKVGGIPDIIEDHKTGLLVEPENPNEIAKAIIKIFSDSEFVQNLVQNAKVNLEKYDWQSIAQKVDLIYKELIKE